MFNKCIIVGARQDVDLTNIKGRLIICADGGLKVLSKLGIKPHVFIGDFDSYKGEVDSDVECIELPKTKDVTDTHRSIQYALDMGVKDIILTGCTNGRADHYLANIFLLEYIEKNNAHGVILDRQNRIELYNRVDYKLLKYKYVSILPLTETCSGVTLRGMKYPLNNATLYRYESLGISNEALESDFKIEILKGKALIIMSVDDNYEV